MTTQTAAPQAWHDSKRYLWLFSPMVPGLAVIAFALYLAFGWGVLLWMGPILVYVIIPTLDFLIGEDSSNPPENFVLRDILDNAAQGFDRHDAPNPAPAASPELQH